MPSPKKGVAKRKPRPVKENTGKGSLPRPHPNRLRILREKGVALSQEHIAKLVGIDDSTVSRDESGDQPIPRDRIQAYATIYRVPTYELFMEPTPEEVQVAKENAAAMAVGGALPLR